MRSLNLFFRWVICNILALLIIFGASTVAMFSAPGDLDTTFGQGGRTFTDIAVPGYAYFYPTTESMLVQPDGKILVCGRFWEDGISYWYGTFIVRYLPDGTLDASFGNNGKVAVIGPGYPYGAEAIAADMGLQADGKIVLIGQYAVAGGILVQRYTSSGQIDATFGNNGTALVTGQAYEEGTSITVQPDGKIVGAGWDYNPYTQPNYGAIMLFRLNANGSMDASFGSAGTGVVSISDGYYGAKPFVRPDGKVLLVGTVRNSSTVPAHVFVARYHPDGTLDPAFGTGGTVRHQVNGFSSSSSEAALQADGKIVVIGTTSDSAPDARTFLLRFNSDGTVDPQFAYSGILPIGPNLMYYPSTVAVQADGKIVATGNNIDELSHHNQFSIIRLSPTGSLDTTFGGDGLAGFVVNGGGLNNAYASDSVIQPDGKILVTGYFGYYYSDSHEKISLIRVEGGSAPAAEADISGRITTADGRAISRVRISLTDGSGNFRFAQTNPFGYYRFPDVATGQTYTISISSKRYSFAEPSRVVFLADELTSLDFVANP